MRHARQLVAAFCMATLCACGGGGTSPSPQSLLPPDAPAPAPSGSTAPAATPSAAATPAPGPSISATTRIPSTAGRIGLFQSFDYAGGYMNGTQIAAHGKRIDAVWASVEPHAWTAAHPGILVSDYFIMGLDQYATTHHGLQWWQQNHPGWILYACAADGTPTHDLAYMSGIRAQDVPLDIGNSAVVAYQVGTMADAAKANGYTALAIDQVVFWNIYGGGNPNFGQQVRPGEYGCGVWNGATFVRRYSGASDRSYENDVVAYVAEAQRIAHANGLTLLINHPAGPLSDPNESRLLESTDVDLDETGFSDYGNYMRYPELLPRTLAYLRYAQEHGTGMLLIDKFANEGHVDSAGFEYSLATYLLANEGGLLLFVGGANEYGTMQYHPEYDAPIGRACSSASGGPAVFSRRFSGGLAVVNAGGSTQSFALPAGRYRDIENKPLSSGALHLSPHEAYVLLGGTGC